jgi:heme/copper-type cytochrome/quinol oxidase subunit 3
MIRPVLTELALFLAPFAAYALFLLMTKSAILDRASWPPKVLTTLAVVAFVLMIGSFVILAQFSGVPPRSTYVPAWIEDGKLVPGRVK